MDIDEAKARLRSGNSKLCECPTCLAARILADALEQAEQSLATLREHLKLCLECLEDDIEERPTAILFLRGRIHFHYPDGERAKANSGAPSALIAYGRYDSERLACSGIQGKLIAL